MINRKIFRKQSYLGVFSICRGVWVLNSRLNMLNMFQLTFLSPPFAHGPQHAYVIVFMQDSNPIHYASLEISFLSVHNSVQNQSQFSRSIINLNDP